MLKLRNEVLVCTICGFQRPREDLEMCMQESMELMWRANNITPCKRPVNNAWVKMSEALLRPVAHWETPPSIDPAVLTGVSSYLHERNVTDACAINITSVIRALEFIRKGSPLVQGVSIPKARRSLELMAVAVTEHLTGIPSPRVNQLQMARLQVMFIHFYLAYQRHTIGSAFTLGYDQCAANLLFLLGSHDHQLHIYYNVITKHENLEAFNREFARIASDAHLNWHVPPFPTLKKARIMAREGRVHCLEVHALSTRPAAVVEA